MKRYTFLFFALLLACASYAKKVKFSVNMTGQTLDGTGIHVMGDFQTAAGFTGGDWMPNTTLMTQETSDTNIYSIVVDVPAFQKYEYKFVNGDQSYFVEIVPMESRVGYDFNDNRWLWVDSLADDTTFVGALMFGGNAPSGLTLMRFLVDMRGQSSVNAAGVHLSGSFQNWSPVNTMMYSFRDTIYEIIAYDTLGTYEYKFLNGNTAGASEIVPSVCASNGHRSLTLLKDSVLATVCFSECSACATGIPTIGDRQLQLYPNPAREAVNIEFPSQLIAADIRITDTLGRTVSSYSAFSGKQLRWEAGSLPRGIYAVAVYNTAGQVYMYSKLVLE